MSSHFYPYLSGASYPGRRPVGRRRAFPGKKWLRRLLSKAERHPGVVLEDNRCTCEEFCDEFFEICDGVALVAPSQALDFARMAIRLARKLGDPHRIQLARGLLVRALTARQCYAEAGRLLEGYEEKARACCPVCRSDVHYSSGDLLVELHCGEEARDELLKSLEVGGDELSDDRVGRVLVLLSIAYYQLDDMTEAIHQVGKALPKLALDTPRGYFIDTIRYLAIYLGDFEASDDDLVYEYATRFQDRLKGLDQIADVQGHLRWLLGVVAARRGDRRRAFDYLTTARDHLLEAGMYEDAVAVTLDLAQLLSQRSRSPNESAIGTLISSCLGKRGADLPEKLKEGLEKLQEVHARRPEDLHDEILALRSSYRWSFPGRIVKSLGPPPARSISLPHKALIEAERHEDFEVKTLHVEVFVCDKLGNRAMGFPEFQFFDKTDPSRGFDFYNVEDGRETGPGTDVKELLATVLREGKVPFILGKYDVVFDPSNRQRYLGQAVHIVWENLGSMLHKGDVKKAPRGRKNLWAVALFANPEASRRPEKLCSVQAVEDTPRSEMPFHLAHRRRRRRHPGPAVDRRPSRRPGRRPRG